MTRACYEPTTGTIRADLAPDIRPAVIHAGHEGRSVVLHLTHAEALLLRDQLVQAIRRAERAEQGHSGP
jgi:hypothetical protein